MSSRWRLAVLAGMFMLVTACGSGGEGDKDGVASISEPNAPSSTAPKNEGSELDQMRAYAKCMREHGIDVKDPEPAAGGGGGGIGIAVEGGDKEKVGKANEACKQHMPNGGEPEKPTAEDLDRARAMAKCMREHGIEVKEPTMEDPGISVSAGDGTGNDPDAVNKAMEECTPGDAKVDTHGEPAK